MIELGTTTIAEGQNALDDLIAEIEQNNLNLNESETRFQIIDRVILDCLGWRREHMRLEQPQNSQGYTDYELGIPRCVIWEAKRQDKTFELPANPKKKMFRNLDSIVALSGETQAAIQQVQNYCSNRGVEIAVATNGNQIIAFLATRSDGVAPLKGRCFVVNGFEQFQKKFPQVWQMLSPAGIAENRLKRILSVGEDRALPEKMSLRLENYPRHRYPSQLQRTLRELGEFFLVDIVDQTEREIEKKFYEKCYCESGALSQHALVSKRMLASRYASLFDQLNNAPEVKPVQTGPRKTEFSPKLVTAAISQRPVVLIGDVGVGKTSFLKHLIHVSAFEEFRKSLYIYIDLGSQGALSDDLEKFILSEVKKQLYEQYKVDIDEYKFIQSIYHGEISRFSRGIYKKLRKENPDTYNQKLLEFLEDKIQQPDTHLKQAIAHIAKGRNKQIIIVLDNADQRDYKVQQSAFIIAQNFAKDWDSAVFIAVRPQTFHRSRQFGSLTAYTHRVFTISPPRIDHVVEKRLNFALEMAEGRIPIKHIHDIKLQLPNIATYLKALQYSLRENSDLVEFLSNITAGNIRAVIEFVTKFIGSPNVDAEKIINIMATAGQYVIPVHEFWKAALLGENSHYDPQSSIALNLFDIRNVEPKEHFLMPMVLGFLNHEGDHKSSEGFVSSISILEEMQKWGFTSDATEVALRRANNKKLLESPKRVTFEEDESGLFGEMPKYFRISTVGVYHLLRWITEFSYLDAMSFDTPILDEDIRKDMIQRVASFEISDRLKRATTFRHYLTKLWRNSNLAPNYFDWETSLNIGDQSFSRVNQAVERIQSQ